MNTKRHYLYILKFVVCLFLFSSSLSYSQKQQKELNIDDLKNHIHNTSGIQKLKLLDSLCRITRDRIELKYDSIVKVTIEYAIVNIQARSIRRLE